MAIAIVTQGITAQLNVFHVQHVWRIPEKNVVDSLHVQLSYIVDVTCTTMVRTEDRVQNARQIQDFLVYSRQIITHDAFLGWIVSATLVLLGRIM
jgi:hypothetical protein